jgi:hypothetical protein
MTNDYSEYNDPEKPDEPQSVYVVMAEEGEWSERNVWISGVFLDEKEAQRLVEEKTAEDKTADQKWDDWWRSQPRSDKSPPGKEADNYWIEELTLGQWKSRRKSPEPEAEDSTEQSTASASPTYDHLQWCWQCQMNRGFNWNAESELRCTTCQNIIATRGK